MNMTFLSEADNQSRHSFSPISEMFLLSPEVLKRPVRHTPPNGKWLDSSKQSGATVTLLRKVGFHIYTPINLSRISTHPCTIVINVRELVAGQ